MGNESKKHHYIPQSLLRHFSSDTAQTQLYIFDKVRDKSILSSIHDAGCENYFNTVEVDGHTISFEGLFQVNDDQLAGLLHNLTMNRNLKGLTIRDRAVLSEVIAVQIVRTKIFRTTLHSFAEQLAASLSNAGFDPYEVDGFSIPTDQKIRRTALSILFNLNGIVSALNTKQLILIHNPNPGPFWISDNPVVLYNSYPYGERALTSPGIEIYFPISSELVLGLFCSSIEQKICKLLALKHQQIDRKEYVQIYKGLHDGVPVSLGLETRSFLNSLQVQYSSRFLYGPDDRFDQASEILGCYPEVREVLGSIALGEFGEGAPPRERMPQGLWVVVYGNRNHHMMKVDHWDENSEFLDFETLDILTLREIIEDHPLDKAILFQDGYERHGIREIKIEVVKEGLPNRVRISHLDERFNKIRRSGQSDLPIEAPRLPL